MGKAPVEKFHLACLYDVQWQLLRVSLLAKNSEHGGFGTEDGVRRNLCALHNYRQGETGFEYDMRVWRCLNLLNATLLGYGARHDEKHALVLAERKKLTEKHRGFSSELEWDWNVVKKDLVTLSVDNHKGWMQIQDNLARRVYTANRKEKQGTGGMEFRSELQKFLDLMAQVEAL